MRSGGLIIKLTAFARSSLLVGSSYHVLGGVRELDLVIAHQAPTQHPEHFWAGMLDDGSAGYKSRPQVRRQDRPCRGTQVLLFGSNNMVEIRMMAPSTLKAPKLMLSQRRPDHSPHQEKSCDFDSATFTFGCRVRLHRGPFFAAQSRNAILRERGGEFTPVFSPKQVTAQWNLRMRHPSS